jgi:hypothetical protein
MRAGVYAALIAVAVLSCNGAGAACPPGKARDCVVNLGLVPQISQQIVADEPAPAMPAKAWPVQTSPTYTGPTVGAVPSLGRAPEVGYRWAIN